MSGEGADARRVGTAVWDKLVAGLETEVAARQATGDEPDEGDEEEGLGRGDGGLEGPLPISLRDRILRH